MSKKIVLVLGMHRSGTSAITGLLHKLGLPIGNNLLPAIIGDNDTGYWEHADIVDVNNNILNKLNTSWDKLLDSNEINTKEFEYEIDILKSIIESNFCNENFLIVKDPRISRLLPIWKLVLSQLNFSPKICIIFRNPLETADSLYKRDKMPIENALILWLQHYLLAEYHTRSFPRVFIDYDSLLFDTNSSVHQVINNLNLYESIDASKLEDIARSFINAKLKHHSHKTIKIENHVISSWVIDCINLLYRIKAVDEKNIRLKFDNLRLNFNQTLEIFTPLISHQYKQIFEIGSGLENAIQIIGSQKENLSCFEENFNKIDDGYQQAVSMLQERDNQLIKKQSDFAKLSEEFKKIGDSFLHTRKNLIEREKELQNISSDYKQILDENVNKKNELNTLISDYNTLKDSYKKKELQLIKLQSDLNSLWDNYEKTSSGYKQSTDLLVSKENEIENLRNELSNLNQLFQKVNDGFKQALEIINQQKKIQEMNNVIIELEKKDFTNKEKNLNEEEFKLYEAKIDLRVENNSHSKAYRMIEEHCSNKPTRILEVGCSTGFFGKVLKQAGHEVWGLELSEQSSKIAVLRLDKVLQGTIENFLESDIYSNERFDYIIFGDVLEHLTNPLEVLKKCKNYLNKYGAIVASIPNVTHIAVRTMLLEGKWEYSDYGIMDNTHLKFFTKNSIVELFSNSGYEIKRLDSIILNPEDTGVEYNEELLQNVASYVQDDQENVFQYVAIAENSESQNLIAHNNRLFLDNNEKLLCLLPIAKWSIGDIRIANPLEAYSNYYGARVRIRQIGEQTDDDLHWANSVVLQRESNEYTLSLLSILQKMGKKIIFDMDDLLINVPEFLSIHDHSMHVKPYLEEALRMSDAITVTTERLKTQISSFNKNVHVIPNCASTVHNPIHHSSANKATILLGSTDTVRIEFILDVFKKLSQIEYYDLKFIAIGPPAKKLISSGLNVEKHPIMSHEQFKAYITTLNNCIGVIPLDDSLFSSCKSVIKYLDYSLAGIPTICSNVPPYSDVIKNNITGVLCQNEENEWYESICKLIESPEKRKIISSKAREFTKSAYSMRTSADGWNTLLESLTSNQGQSGSKLSLENIQDTQQLEKINNDLSFYRKLFKLNSYTKTYRAFKIHGIKSLKSISKNIYIP